MDAIKEGMLASAKAAEAAILKYYESLPHVGIFEKRDFNHFTTK